MRLRPFKHTKPTTLAVGRLHAAKVQRPRAALPPAAHRHGAHLTQLGAGHTHTARRPPHLLVPLRH
eukprot:276176-Prymnesium_polylepis.1